MLKPLLLIGLAVFGAAASAIIAQAQPSPNNLPQAATPCILKEFKNVANYFKMDSGRYSQFAKTQYQGKDYYLLGVFPQGSPHFMHLIVSLDNQGQCDVPFFNPHGDFMSFSPSVPQPVAQEFALQMIQKYVQELGGVKAYQKYLIQQAKDGPLSWTPEERWAINRLGVRLPANVKIDGPPNSPN
jgi:hypothetical protein